MSFPSSASRLHWIFNFCLLFSQKPEILTSRSNEILTAVIHGARKEEPSQEVQLAAITALLNSLEFVRDNFEREVCGRIHSPSPSLKS